MESEYGPHLWAHHFAIQGDAMPTLRRGDLFELLERAAEEFPHRPHLSYQGETWAYAQTHELSLRLAAALREKGLQPGDRVGLCLPNCPAYIVLCFALWRLGAVGVGMNLLYSEPHLRQQAADAGLSLLIVASEAQAEPKVVAVARHLGCEILPCRPDLGDLAPAGGDGLADLVAARPPAALGPRPQGHDLAMLQYTGGTTGAPKGAMMTHAGLLAATAQALAWMNRVERGVEAWHAPAPLTHISGLINYACIATAAAGECLLVSRFQAAELVQQLRDGRPTILTAIPTMLTALLASPDLEDLPWDRIKHVIAGGAPSPLDLLAEVKRRTGLVVQQAYGMTETCGTATGMPTGVSGCEDATGAPLPGVRIEIRASDDPTRALPIGECGEICIGGPNLMVGYWRAAEAQSPLTPDGLLRSGDLGLMTPDGFLHVVDRLKDLAICSGYNVYPRVVDEAVLQHPDIREAISLGMPDSYRGETIVVAAALKAGRSLTLDQLQDFLDGRLSPVEMPKRLVVLDELPKSENGKLSRVLVRAQLLATPADA